MTANRTLPAGTTDYAGDDYMDKLKAEVEALWGLIAAPLGSVAGTNTITGALSPSATAYSDGMGVLLKPANTNTGGVTLNVDSLGAKTVYDYSGNALEAGALVAGRVYELRYFTADNGFRVLSGTLGQAAVRSGVVLVQHTATNGTAGGTATSGSYQDYPLETVARNDLSSEGAGLSSNIVTLPPGTYDVFAAVPFNDTDGTRLRLRNNTDGATLTDVVSNTVKATAVDEIKIVTLSGRFTITASKGFKLQYRVATTNSGDGLGNAASFSETEVYGFIQFTRVPAGQAWRGDMDAGHIFGLTLSNNGSDANNDIDIAAGGARSSDDLDDILLTAALTKRLDASWAVGTGNGGMQSGSSKSSNQTIAIYQIKRSDTAVVDAIAVPVGTALALPTNYDRSRRIGYVRTDGSGNIRAFTQDGDEFRYTTPVAADVADSGLSTSSSSKTLSVPPSTRARFRAYGSNASAWSILLRPLTETDAAPNTATGLVSLAGAAGEGDAGHFEMPVNASSQIGARASAASTTINIATSGWIDTRGRLN